MTLRKNIALSSRSHWPLLGLVLGVSLFSLAAAYPSRDEPHAKDPTPDQVTFFEAKIRPILVANCVSCHGKSLQLGGLRLDSAAALQKGGDSGPAVVGGDPDKSRLILAVRQTGPLKMPQGGKL